MRGVARMWAFFVKLKYTLSQIESQGLLNKHTMRNQLLDAWRLALQSHVRRMDIVAVALLLAYTILAAATQLGASVAGQGPDPSLGSCAPARDAAGGGGFWLLPVLGRAARPADRL